MKKKLQILILSLSALASGGFSLTAQADVMGFVEDTLLEGNVYQHAISPDGQFVFSTTLSPAQLYVHRRDPETGKLTLVQKIEKADLVPGKTTFFNPQGMVVSPDSKQLYISTVFGEVGDSDLPFDESVVRFDISSNGLLSYHSRVITGKADTGLVISPKGKFLYVGSASSSGAPIAVLKRANNGNISLVETVKTDSNGNELDDTQSISISPDGKTLYASSLNVDGHLYIYNLDKTTGHLTGVDTLIHNNIVKPIWRHSEDTPVPGSGGAGVAITKDGKFLYSVGGYGEPSSEQRRSITIFKRQSNGKLEHFKDIKSPDSGNGLGILFATKAHLILSPNEKYIYTFDPIINTIGVWKRNTTTGDLTFLDKIDEISNNTSGNKLVSSKDGRHVYLNASNKIKVYDLRSDLEIVKSGPSTNVAPNGTISYTLAVTNNGPSDAQNVVVTDTLPAGTSYISGTVNSASGSCSASGQKVTCSMGKFAVNDGYNAIIQVKAPTAEGTITNTASVTADQLDTKTTDNSDSVTTTIKKGGSTLPPVTGGGTGGSGGGSMPLSLFVLLLPALLRRRFG